MEWPEDLNKIFDEDPLFARHPSKLLSRWLEKVLKLSLHGVRNIPGMHLA